MVAARNGHAKVVAALLKAGADIGLVDKSVQDQKVTAVEYAKGWPHQVGNERRDDCLEIISEFLRTGQRSQTCPILVLCSWQSASHLPFEHP
mmetsp:Transcript_9098/g.10103  ORF Transcript_9098/g.10103 Transcript_9098/m.10103 type:complete len:92 (-) Transcript_9098:113-388(-)